MSEVETTPPPFVLSQKISVAFKPEQILELALKELAERGHTLDPKSITSSINKAGLTITPEMTEGKVPPKKRVVKKKATPKVEAKSEPVKSEPKNKADTESKDKVESKEDTTTKADEVNPFEATSPKVDDSSNEATIAKVKEEAGVTKVAAFSTEVTEIVESDSKEAPAADSAEINPFDFTATPGS